MESVQQTHEMGKIWFALVCDRNFSMIVERLQISFC